jgi:hypothetical protein
MALSLKPTILEWGRASRGIMGLEFKDGGEREKRLEERRAHGPRDGGDEARVSCIAAGLTGQPGRFPPDLPGKSEDQRMPSGCTTHPYPFSKKPGG